MCVWSWHELPDGGEITKSLSWGGKSENIYSTLSYSRGWADRRPVPVHPRQVPASVDHPTTAVQAPPHAQAFCVAGHCAQCMAAAAHQPRLHLSLSYCGLLGMPEVPSPNTLFGLYKEEEQLFHLYSKRLPAPFWLGSLRSGGGGTPRIHCPSSRPQAFDSRLH